MNEKMSICDGCKYYSNPFIDNNWLQCLHPLGIFREFLQTKKLCPGYFPSKNYVKWLRKRVRKQ